MRAAEFRGASLAQSAPRQSHSQIKPRNPKVVSSILTQGTSFWDRFELK